MRVFAGHFVEPMFIILGLLIVTILDVRVLSETVKPSATSQKGSSTMQMPLVAPLFVESDEFSSSLVLVNASASKTFADLSIRSLDGSVISSERVQIPPQGQRRLEVRELLSAACSSATSGSILVMPNPASSGATAAALSITYLQREPNYIDEEVAMPGMEGSQVLRAVADHGEGSPLVAITSLSESAQHVIISCTSHQQRAFFKLVELNAGETLVTEACEKPTSHNADFSAVWQEAKATASDSVGISLTSDAMPGSFAAFGLEPHAAEGARYFSSVPFSDPKMTMSATTVFTGVPVGRSVYLTEGTYIPQLSLANFSSRDSKVMVQYSRISDQSPVVTEVKTLLVPGMSSREVRLENLQGDSEIQNSFVVISDANPGDMLSKLVAISDSQLHEVELIGKDQHFPDSAGNHPWTLEEGTESILLLFNPGTRRQIFRVLISTGNKTVWSKDYWLKPMETKALNVRELIQERVPDDRGTLLPRDAANGEIGWVGSGSGNGRGRLLQANRNRAWARNFSCAYIPEPCNVPSLSVTPSEMIVSQRATGSSNFPVCAAPNVGSCATDNVVVTNNYPGFTYTWSPNGSNGVVSVSPNSTPISANITGVGGGSSSISVTVKSGSNCTDIAGPVTETVQNPSYCFSPSATHVSQPAACTNEGATGYFIDIFYYVADSSSNRVSQLSMAPRENLGDGTGWHDSFATPTTTRSDGSFDDTPSGACYVTSGHFCEGGSSQTFRLTANSTVFSIATNTLVRACTDGIKKVIQGNPEAQDKTYIFGNTQ